MDPAEIVQESIDAYNANDIPATFVSFHPEVVVWDADGNVLLRGLDDVRARYAKVRADNPAIHYEIVRRIASGDWVVDEERVTGLAEPRAEETLNAVIVYRVSDHQVREIRILT